MRVLRADELWAADRDASTDEVIIAVTMDELALLSNAMGVALQEIEDWEFQTLLGATREEARELISKMSLVYGHHCPTVPRPVHADYSEPGSRMMRELDEETLDWLLSLHREADLEPWVAMIEGRDHLSGDSFIMIGTGADRRDDMYVTRDSGPAGPATLDLIAAARTFLPALISEVRRLRGGLAC